jgi:hypothetical protein
MRFSTSITMGEPDFCKYYCPPLQPLRFIAKSGGITAKINYGTAFCGNIFMVQN